ncbi:hypothetical protein [Agrobacterium fabrum]|uniref:hypothetical protein n=1 Tax=Agrobacterium fabrum TaxID=1176649 RepID=UPI003BA25FCB
MTAITPQAVADLGRFLYQHTDCSEKSARSIIRAASAGQPISLPNAVDFGGEVLRGQLATIFKLIPAVAGDAIAAPPPMASASSTPATAEANNPPAPISSEDRAAAIRAMCGPERADLAASLIATNASVTDAATALRIVNANTPASRFPPGYMTVEERARGENEFGGSYEAPATPKSEANDGWRKAFAAAQAGGVS